MRILERIVLIGSNGQLAFDINALLADKYEIIPLEHKDFYIENEEQVHSTLRELQPNFVINTAAFVNVGECEKNPQQAFIINGIAVKYLADICNEIDTTLVHFSSDYVFGMDETRATLYTETDLPGPVQVYGISKLAGELLLQQYCKKYFCLRVSGLYGLKGTAAKNFPIL